ncbi:MAG: hypothetical protein HY026_03655 [Deltaproteobacteria bacterium]|nr:hypothetical protein [Deltaproteobacteria bacterium]
MAGLTFFKEMGTEEDNAPIISEIRSDMGGKSSPLKLLSRYLSEAKGSTANDPPVFLKLAKLFDKGIAPKKVEGHFFGVTMGLRTGKRKGLLRRYGNILNILWGKLLADAPP